MTSDAKIGLLLGLIFIFVIAFVINGLPSLHPPVGKAAANTQPSAPDEEFAGITGRTDRAVSNSVEPQDPPRTGHDGSQMAFEDPKPVAPEPPLSPPTPLPVAAAEGTRAVLSLPPMEKLLAQLPLMPQKNEVATINVDTPERLPEQPVTSERSPVVAVPPSRPEPISEPTPGETPAKSAAATAASKPTAGPGETVYTTVAGDNLAAIAKKVYGADEGNRVANIDRLFHRNEATLKSADKVSIGMKLIVPPLPKVTAGTPADVLPATFFEKASPDKPTTIKDKVQLLVKPAITQAPDATSDGRWYTVQDGDKLWKIAASQLGAGSRWDEIYKLNSDILKSQDSLKVGTRLRLPPK
jgi:nucleoid-associated protein YgaU